MISLTTVQFTTRTELELNVSRDRHTLYRENNIGLIENIYTLMLVNKSQSPMTLNVSTVGLNHSEVIGITTLTLSAGEVLNHLLIVAAEPASLEQRITPFEFSVQADNANQTVDEVRHKQPSFINEKQISIGI
jgi:polyferredoxin